MSRRWPQPPQGWPALRWEIGVVFVGVVLALGAQQLADALYWQGQAAQAKRAIEAELMEHEVDSYERLIVQPCLTGQLRALHSRLASHRGEWRGSPMLTRQESTETTTKLAIPTAYRAPARCWSKEAWERAQATGALNHLPDALVATYAQIYTRSLRNKQIEETERAAAARLSALAVDGSIEPASRIMLLEAIALTDQANSTVVNDAGQNLDRLRLALRDVPRERRKKALAERFELQRRFRGTCVKDVPIQL